LRTKGARAWNVLVAALIIFLMLPTFSTPFLGASFGLRGKAPNEGESPVGQPLIELTILELRANGTVIVNAIPPSDDSMTNPDYELQFFHWYETAKYWINPSNTYGFSPSAVVSAVTASADTWDKETSAAVFSYQGTTTKAAGVEDGYNVVAWDTYTKPSSIAVTYIWSIGRRMIETDTLMNVAFNWSLSGEAGKMDVQNIMTHEFGHWAGLDDLYVDRDYWLTMYGYASTGEMYKRTLGLGDILGLQAVYYIAPDLTVTAVYLRPEHPKVSENVTLYADIENQGNGDANNFFVYCYLDGKLYASFQASLAAGASTTLGVLWKATGGSHIVRWVADATGLIAESNEANNEMSLAFWVPTLALSPAVGPVGTEVTASGAGFAPNSTVRVSFNSGEVAATATTDANGSFQVTFEVPPSISGAHVVNAKDASGKSAVAAFNVVPSITISPKLGYPLGTNVTVYGSGFDGKTVINIAYGGNLVARATQDLRGSFKANFTVPVSPSGAHNITATDVSGNEGSAIFTVVRVIIDRASPLEARVDVGSTQRVYFHAAWEGLGSPVENGLIYVNGTEYVTNSTGWIASEAASNAVARKVWIITSVYANGVKEYVQEAPNPSIIFDRIKINSFSVADNRIDVGDIASFNVAGVYEYDNGTWSGTYTLNDTATKNAVGKYGYKIASVTDFKYGLKVFRQTSPDLYVIFDKVIVRLSLSDDRINVGSRANIIKSGVYEYDGTTFIGAINLNDTETKNIVGKYGYRVSSISDPTYGLTAFSSNEVFCIFDRLVVSFKGVDNGRRDIGTAGEVRFRLRSEYDGAEVRSGSVTINGSIAAWDATNSWWKITYTLSEVGKRSFVVDSVSWGAYNITALNLGVAMNYTSIIWDRIKITGMGSVDGRIDIGTTGTFWATAVLEYDNHPLGSGDSLTINGILMTWSSANNRFEGTETKNTVQAVTYNTFTGGNEANYGITFGTMNGYSTTIIWDRVNINVFSAIDKRINVGSTVSFTAGGVSEYDGAPWVGSYTLNDTTTKKVVGRYGYRVASITDSKYGLTAFRQTAPDAYVIFDKVSITLTVSDDRINVGGAASITALGIYDYDRTPWSGTFKLNDTVVKDEVGRYAYTVSKMTDANYGLTAFKSNVVFAVFDEIRMYEGGVSKPHCEVGSTQIVWLRAQYAYDLASFDGSKGMLYLNGSPMAWSAEGARWDRPVSSDALGERRFKVSAVVDDVYQLTAIKDLVGEQRILWDRLEVSEMSFGTDTPGEVKVRVRATYNYTGAPVTGATVTMGETKCVEVEPGTYAAKVSTWSPVLALSLRIEVTGFTPLSTSRSMIHAANLALNLVIGAVVIIGVGYALRKKGRGKKDEVGPSNEIGND